LFGPEVLVPAVVKCDILLIVINKIELNGVVCRGCDCHQTRPGARVVTSWTSHVLPSGSLKDKNDP
jgi:hypothetical protein